MNGLAAVAAFAPACRLSLAAAKVLTASPLIESSRQPASTSSSSSAHVPGLMYSTSGHASVISAASSQTPAALFFFLPRKTMPALDAAAPGSSVRNSSDDRLAARAS